MSRIIELSAVKRYLPWVVATALFMEQLDTTIVNTAVPVMAKNLHVTPLDLKAVVTCYTLSLAVCIPISGWMADRFGTRRVFASAVALFTLSSALCGLALNLPILVVARVLQGAGAAMMMPVGRVVIVRAFEKNELLKAMNFVVIPGLIGPLLGPTVGGLIVHWLSWRYIFFINIPVGLTAQLVIYRFLPDFYGDRPRPLDIRGFILFGGGVAIISWLLEIFGQHNLGAWSLGLFAAIGIGLLLGYGWHSRRTAEPLLRLVLFRIRTFRISVLGGFLSRIGVGATPFLLPLLYQVGFGLPSWQSGLMMIPAPFAAITMRFIVPRLLARVGFRQVLIANTVLIGITLSSYSFVGPTTPLLVIILLGLANGFFNSLQFGSINFLAFADINAAESSMASSIISSMQQMALSFGLATGALITGWYLEGHLQSDRVAVTTALHHAFRALGAFVVITSLPFWMLRRHDGASVSGNVAPGAGPES